MNPDAKVKMRGVQVGKVTSIESLPDGTAALHLAMDPSQMQLIPANVNVDIASSTVFGSKFVELVGSRRPVGASRCRPGQVLNAEHVTVEINTVFQQLVSVLDKVQPEKLNETLGAISQGVQRPRREDSVRRSPTSTALLAKLDPSLPNLEHEIEAAAAGCRAPTPTRHRT